MTKRAEKRVETDGERLRRLRQTAGMSQQSLAQAAGISIGTVTGIEQSKWTLASARVETVQALARALGCSVEELIDGGNGGKQ